MTAGSDYNLITFNAQHPYMLKEAAKRYFRSLLQRVLSIHIGNKYTTSPIVMENILANSTRILQFSEEETTAQTSEGVKRNYADLERCMVSIMKEIYGNDARSKLPKGLSHLLDGMVDDSLDVITWTLWWLSNNWYACWFGTWIFLDNLRIHYSYYLYNLVHTSWRRAGSQFLLLYHFWVVPCWIFHFRMNLMVALCAEAWVWSLGGSRMLWVGWLSRLRFSSRTSI